MTKTLKIPRGWRVIPENEVIKAGDMFECDFGFMQCGSSVGKTREQEGFKPNTRVIRKIRKTARKKNK
jgi:hypothetical protein